MNSTSLLLLALMAVAFWLLVLRPARKRQKDAQDLQSAIAVGDEVMTGSGIFGTVVALDDERFQLEVSPGVRIWFLRPALAKVIEPTAPELSAEAAASVDQGDADASIDSGVSVDDGDEGDGGSLADGIDGPAAANDESRARTTGGLTD